MFSYPCNGCSILLFKFTFEIKLIEFSKERDLSFVNSEQYFVPYFLFCESVKEKGLQRFHTMITTTFSLFLTAAPPDITVEKNWVHASEGFDITLTCTVHGDVSSEVRY